ncbi:hypothetical protein BGX38DRAFT_1158762 [Terfezia claveryi]|nr:hypothetical protein BGX38DRAFT_1158762 [Terfezia claveryi]
MFQSHQPRERSGPPSAPRPQHTATSPVSRPPLAAFTQPWFRLRSNSLTPPSPPLPTPRLLPLATQSASRTSVPSSIQYPPTAPTSSGAAFPQTSFSNSYVLPSKHPRSSPPPSYPSTHNHPLPVSIPSSAVSSNPFFTSPYDQPHPQTIPSSTQFASPTSAPSSTQSHPNLSVSSSSSQLLPSTQWQRSWWAPGSESEFFEGDRPYEGSRSTVPNVASLLSPAAQTSNFQPLATQPSSTQISSSEPSFTETSKFPSLLPQAQYSPTRISSSQIVSPHPATSPQTPSMSSHDPMKPMKTEWEFSEYWNFLPG